MANPFGRQAAIVSYRLGAADGVSVTAGQWIRARVQPETFKTVFFCGLLLLGLYLAARGALRF